MPNLRRNARAIHTLTASMLLILMSVMAAGALWFFLSSMFSKHKTTIPGFSRIEVEAARLSGTNIIIYVRNTGDKEVKIGSIYVKNTDRTPVKSVDLSSGYPLTIWGGDKWSLKGSPNLLEAGLIFYDDFDTLSSTIWEIRENDHVAYGNVRVSNGYLKVNVRGDGSTWATYGVSTRNAIQLPSSYVVEAELWKQGRAYWRYATCIYITSRNDDPNPYNNTPWFAFKLYPRGSITYAQVVYRSSSVSFVNLYSWSGRVYPHAHVLMQVFSGGVSVKLWDGRRDEMPEVEGSYAIPTISGDAYVFLTVDNPTSYTDEGDFGYLKIYRDLSVIFTDLEPGHTYKLIDADGGECIFTPSSQSITINPLAPPPGCESLRTWIYRHGYPWRGVIISEAITTIKPRELKAFTIDASNLSSGKYLVEVHTTDGSMASVLIEIP